MGVENRPELITMLPEGVDEMHAVFAEAKPEFSQVTNCFNCEMPLPLRERDIHWPIGPYDFIFPGIPSYHCDPCDITHFPEEVREILALSVERELEVHPPQAPKPNPRAVAFYEKYR